MPHPSRLPPIQHRYVDTGIVKIHVAELPADQPALVLLHGVGMDWRVWQSVSRRLHPYFHLYMLDLRGHGESDKPFHGYSIADYAADVEDVIDRLALSHAALAGSSLGGVVAAAVEIPVDIVSSRILIDPPLTGGPIRDEQMFRRILELKHGDPSILSEYLRQFYPRTSLAFLREMGEMWQRTARGVIQDMLNNKDRYFAIDAALREDESPTLLMRADARLGPALRQGEAQRTLKMLPHGYEVEVIGAGHAIHADQPEKFVDLVRSFTRGQYPTAHELDDQTAGATLATEDNDRAARMQRKGVDDKHQCRR